MKNPNKDPAFLSQVPIRYQVLPLASREWKNGSDSSYNCTPFLHSLLTKGNIRSPEALMLFGQQNTPTLASSEGFSGFRSQVRGSGLRRSGFTEFKTSEVLRV